MVGDNCNVNKGIANALKLPFVGCASHRLNLAVKQEIEEGYDDLLRNIEALHKALRKKKQAGKLRKKTLTVPQLRNVTRWSSSYKMIESFLKIQEYIDFNDNDLRADTYYSRNADVPRVKEMFKDLQYFQAASEKLQLQKGVSLATVRDCFDCIIAKYPGTKDYLDPAATIVKDHDFENAIVKLCEGNTALTQSEANAVVKFRVHDNDVATAQSMKPQEMFDKDLKRRKISTYVNVKWIPPTTNDVERLFSRAKLVRVHLRCSLTPDHLDSILLLTINRSWWSVRTVAKALIPDTVEELEISSSDDDSNNDDDDIEEV